MIDLKQYIKDNISIADVLSREFGADFSRTSNGKAKICCPMPWHQEKTPSFHVDLSKNYAICFGQCGTKGDVIDMVGYALFGQSYDKQLHFRDCLDHIANRYSIPSELIQNRGNTQQDPTRALRLLDAEAVHDLLTVNSEYADAVRAFLSTRYNFTGDNAAECGIGLLRKRSVRQWVEWASKNDLSFFNIVRSGMVVCNSPLTLTCRDNTNVVVLAESKNAVLVDQNGNIASVGKDVFSANQLMTLAQWKKQSRYVPCAGDAMTIGLRDFYGTPFGFIITDVTQNKVRSLLTPFRGNMRPTGTLVGCHFLRSAGDRTLAVANPLLALRLASEDHRVVGIIGDGNDSELFEQFLRRSGSVFYCLTDSAVEHANALKFARTAELQGKTSSLCSFRSVSGNPHEAATELRQLVAQSRETLVESSISAPSFFFTTARQASQNIHGTDDDRRDHLLRAVRSYVRDMLPGPYCELWRSSFAAHFKVPIADVGAPEYRIHTPETMPEQMKRLALSLRAIDASDDTLEHILASAGGMTNAKMLERQVQSENPATVTDAIHQHALLAFDYACIGHMAASLQTAAEDKRTADLLAQIQSYVMENSALHDLAVAIPKPAATVQAGSTLTQCDAGLYERYFALHEAYTAKLHADLMNTSLKWSDEARSFLTHRGLGSETCERFGLGTVGNETPQTLRRWAEDNGFNLVDLLVTGLMRTRGFSCETRDGANVNVIGVNHDNMLIADDNKVRQLMRSQFGSQEAEQINQFVGEPTNYYAAFRNRIMFPYRLEDGRIAGFSGRALDDNAKAKYYNTWATPYFRKNELLYGIENLPEYCERVFLVEGQFDVIRCQINGIHAVGLGGTASGENKFSTLAKRTKDVCACLDGDAAGQKAAVTTFESIVSSEPGISRITVMTLPEGRDPDDMLRTTEGKAQFAKLAQQAIPAPLWWIEQEKEIRGITRNASPEHQRRQIAALAQDATSLLENMLNKEYREAWRAALSSRLSLPPRTLFPMINGSTPAADVDAALWLCRPEDQLIRALIHDKIAEDKIPHITRTLVATAPDHNVRSNLLHKLCTDAAQDFSPREKNLIDALRAMRGNLPPVDKLIENLQNAPTKQNVLRIVHEVKSCSFANPEQNIHAHDLCWRLQRLCAPECSQAVAATSAVPIIQRSM